MKEAVLYDKLADSRVQCHLCAHRCTIKPDHVGICAVRENRGGTLYSLVYGRPISVAVDPIEKKPLFHFYPGTTSFSIATVGCNLRCRFCQNADISQWPRERKQIAGDPLAPEAAVHAARDHRCRSVSYTYTEPTVFAEYARDIAAIAHQEGLANCYVTNGFMTPEMLDYFYPLLDAANVDLKSFRDDFYKEQCGARLQPVLDNLKRMVQQRVWVEVTTLLIPDLNDGDDELREIAGFIVQELGPQVPWHISRFHPTYEMLDHPPTPIQTLHRAKEIGLAAGLRYVYEGNVPGAGGEDTACPQCGRIVIHRFGFRVLEYALREGHCLHCGATVDGVGL